MDIYTLNVGQGQFVVVTGDTEAIIVDTFIALNPKKPIINVKGALVDILKGKNLIGIMITGFDSDHFNPIGLNLVLNKYRPKWIMYPKYTKRTVNADTCFSIISSFDRENDKFQRIPMILTDDSKRVFGNYSKDFSLEVFSPHKSDMTSSNNCSLVCKIIEKSTMSSYLVTGDTENSRWDGIVDSFGGSLSSDILDAPHHGSKNGITTDAMSLINPYQVIISAGVDNAYGHPDKEAIKIYKAGDRKPEVFTTNSSDGKSYVTKLTARTFKTEIYS